MGQVSIDKLKKIEGFSKDYRKLLTLETLAFEKAGSWKNVRDDWWFALILFFDRAFYQGRRDELSSRFERATVKALENEFIDLFDGDEKTRKAVLFGAKLPLLGMRLFLESQKSVLELTKASNQSVVDMVKASQSNSENVAAETVNALMPQILGTIERTAQAQSPNPMQAMLTRLVEPMMQRVMGNVTGQPTGLPPGWKITSKEG